MKQTEQLLPDLDYLAAVSVFKDLDGRQQTASVNVTFVQPTPLTVTEIT